MTQRVAGIDEAEVAKQSAIYSYNVIDITKPPLPFENEFNPRPVNVTRVASMRNALLTEGFRVFAQENRIMILISPTCVDPSCITMDPHGEPKSFALQKPCALKVLSIIGGQHRREAAIYIKKEYQKKLDDVVAAIEKRKSKRSSLKSRDVAAKERLSDEINELEESRAKYIESLEFVGPWGVLLLDPGKHHLSQVDVDHILY